MAFVEVAKLWEMARGGIKGVKAGGNDIVLCNCDDGKVYAVSRTCTHVGGPLDEGTLEGYILTCPWHHSQFDVRSGKLLAGPNLEGFVGEPTFDLETYPVRVEGDLIKIDI